MKYYAIAIAFKQVFTRVNYLIEASSIAIMIFAMTVWFPNLSLIYHIFSEQLISMLLKFQILFELLGSIYTNYTFFSAISLMLISILFGIYITMLTYYFSQKISSLKKAKISTGIGGMASGILGIGCISCGSSFLMLFLAMLGIPNALLFLPFHGNEFAVLGVLMLLASIIALSKEIGSLTLCQIQQ